MRFIFLQIIFVLCLNVTTVQAQSDTWFDAVKSGDFDTVKSLIESGADVNETDSDGSTPLMWASGEGHTKIVELLISKGAHINAVGAKDWTAITGISKCEHPLKEIVLDTKRYWIGGLVEHNETTNYRTTALMWASGERHIQTVELLIAKGARVNVFDNKGSTPLMWASRCGHTQTVELLNRKGS